MTNLRDKRVGIIGTGATAVQCIPHLAESAGELIVFQRTPSSIDVRNNRPLTDADFDPLEPGWQREWHRNFATLQEGGTAEVDLVQDGWTDIAKRIRARVMEKFAEGTNDDVMTVIQRAFADSDDDKMDEIRARVDDVVNDRATAEALKPWYRQVCKRPCFHDEYLQAFNRPNTTLVDTDGRGVEKIDETGVWVAGQHYELDCLVIASGFEVNVTHTANYETVGRDGRLLSRHWADGMRSLHGLQVNGFPNLFILGIAQGGNLRSNVTHNFVEAASAIAAVVSHCRENGLAVTEVSEEAESAWVSRLEAGLRPISAQCTPGYYNGEGREITDRDRQNGARFPGGAAAFFAHLEDWAANGEFAGLDFEPATPNSTSPDATQGLS